MTDQPARPYADSVMLYGQAGWAGVLPVPPQTKTPPPPGYTGATGVYPEPMQLALWADSHATSSVALRMPYDEAAGWCVIGIDVDQYENKRGAETLSQLMSDWGPLPATFSSTARGAGQPSRILFYRAPAQRYGGQLEATLPTGERVGDIEIVQKHHRYAVVWPSVNSKADGGRGAQYRWYGPDGNVLEGVVPRPDQLPPLPDRWVAGLVEGAASESDLPAAIGLGYAMLAQLAEDHRVECADVTTARVKALHEVGEALVGSRHAVMNDRLWSIVNYGASGHPGVARAFDELREAWAVVTAGEGREAEYEELLLGAARKAVTRVGPTQLVRDPCFSVGAGRTLPSLIRGDPMGPGRHDLTVDQGAQDVTIYKPQRWESLREAIGAHTFDPHAGTDHWLAEAVLERVRPVMRYAYDSKGWLLRQPERWELHGSLTKTAVAHVSPLMPVGDPEAEKGSDEKLQAERRGRFMATGTGRLIASKMDDLVIAGWHPSTVALADLDSDPEILWAGGYPFDLRLCGEQLTLSGTHDARNTPHLHTAAVAPLMQPTPLWDAFLAAVWPDPELRAWSMRVLSIALTGYSDRALPILLGPTGRGKTSLIALVMSVLGTYAHSANPKLLAPGNEHDTIVFDLKGRRLSFIDEAPSDAKAGQERLKQITGGARLQGRQMNQDPITFDPTHTLVLTANDEPVLTDAAVRSRVRLLPCEGDPDAVRATRAALGHPSGAVWRREAPGVLALLMREAAGWLNNPDTGQITAAPEPIRYLAENLGADQDPTTVWVREETERFDAGHPARELYQQFVASCRRSSMRPDAIPTETKWGRTLTSLGYPAWHTNTGRLRPLRVRQAGFTAPQTPPPVRHDESTQPGPSQPVQDSTKPPALPPATGIADGSGGSNDGVMDGSNPKSSQAFQQVNPPFITFGEEYEGLYDITGASRTRMQAPEAQGESSSNPPRDPSATPSPKPAKRRTSEATERAARLRDEKRRAAIAEASGPTLSLPVVVQRNLEVRPCSLDDAAGLLGVLADLREVTVDVETTGYPIGHRDYAIRTVQLGTEAYALVLDPHDPAHRPLIVATLANAVVLHAHSATADLIPLSWAGLLDLETAWPKMRDTVVLAKLVDPQLTGNEPGLKELSAAMLKDYAASKPADAARSALFKAGKWLTEVKVTHPVERSGWAQVDPRCETMLRYAAADVLDDAAIAARLPMPSPEILLRELTAQRMTAKVADVGIRLDGEHIEAMVPPQQAALADAGTRLAEFGIENPGSDQQVGAAFTRLGVQLPRTGTGRPSVKAAAVTPLAQRPDDVGRLAQARLDYQKAETALGLFLEPYRVLVERGDGRARPTIYTLSADTGRMSAVRPNIQQLPRSGGFRACFTADPGQVLVSADFAGVELRVAAALSGDTNLIAILSDPSRDLHSEVAALAFGAGATKDMRYRVKRGVFGRIYGGGVEAVANGVGVDLGVAQNIIDAMDAIAPQLTEWSRECSEAVKAGHLQFQTYSGRIVHMNPDKPHAAGNYRIQGSARELLIDALMRWEQTPWGGAVLFPVHDEVVAAVPEADAAAATTALVQCMTSQLNGIPIIAEASAPSFAWADSA